MQLSILLSAGLLLAWVGERIVDSAEARWALTGIGVLLVLAATVLRFTKAKATPQGQVHRTLALLHVTTVGALVLYALQSDLFSKLTGEALSVASPKLAGVFAALWPALLVTSLLPTLFVELSFASMAKAPVLEPGRVREALLSGAGLGFALIFAFSAQYVATERNSKVDLSHFRVAKVSEATQKLAASLDESTEIWLFFPPASDVGEAVSEYFKDLQKGAPQLQVTRLDHALEPVKSKDLGVTGNGTVVLKKGGRKENLFVGIEAEKSKTQLRGLDVEVNKKLTQVGRPKRTIYFTGGHGERGKTNADSQNQRATIDTMHRVLAEQNLDIRTLTTAEGLGAEIPKDAEALFIIGPTSDFDEGERAVLASYVNGGGKLFIALDPDSGDRFEGLLSALGLNYLPHFLAQERGVANVKPPPGKADRINIATRTFSSHPIATYLGRGQSPVLFLGAGGLEEAPMHPSDLHIDFAVRSLAETWADLDRNFEFDKGEQRRAYGLVAAVERKAEGKNGEQPMRAIVLGDSDAIADVVLSQIPGNQALVVDGFKWLFGDEKLAGPTNTEADVPLTRTKQEDALWFYGTTFLAPLAVVGLGFLARRRKPKPAVGGAA